MSNELSGKVICFTGKLEFYTREESKEIAESFGMKVSSTVTKDTNYLVVGDKAGSKLKKAESLGVKILSEDDWNELIEEIE